MERRSFSRECMPVHTLGPSRPSKALGFPNSVFISLVALIATASSREALSLKDRAPRKTASTPCLVPSPYSQMVTVGERGTANIESRAMRHAEPLSIEDVAPAAPNPM
jgi:hypothetical protein